MVHLDTRAHFEALADDRRVGIEGENSRGQDLPDGEREDSNPNFGINRYSGGSPGRAFAEKNFCAYGVHSERIGGMLCLHDQTETGYCPHKLGSLKIADGRLLIPDHQPNFSFVPYDPLKKLLTQIARENT